MNKIANSFTSPMTVFLLLLAIISAAAAAANKRYHPATGTFTCLAGGQCCAACRGPDDCDVYVDSETNWEVGSVHGRSQPFDYGGHCQIYSALTNGTTITFYSLHGGERSDNFVSCDADLCGPCQQVNGSGCIEESSAATAMATATGIILGSMMVSGVMALV